MDNMTVVPRWCATGGLRALGITGPSRFFVLPDVPTFAEQGVRDYAVTSWLGLAGPAGLPRRCSPELNEEVVEPQGAGHHRAPEEDRRRGAPDHVGGLRARVASDIEKWTKIVAGANIERI